MASVNKVILIGALGRDPEVRFMPSGDAMANLSIATSEQWKDKGGEKQERTEWHRVVCFGKQAETIGKHFQKGSQIYIEGRLQTRKWTDKSNVEHYTTEIVLDRFQFMGGKSGNVGSEYTREQIAEIISELTPEQKERLLNVLNEPSGQAKGNGTQQQNNAPKSQSGGSFDDMEDDIPF